MHLDVPDKNLKMKQVGISKEENSPEDTTNETLIRIQEKESKSDRLTQSVTWHVQTGRLWKKPDQIREHRTVPEKKKVCHEFI